jgi:alpha-beta hydrolase superfamily lysophospholipase
MLWKWAIGPIVALGLSTGANAQNNATAVTLHARDGTLIAGLVYEAPNPKAVVLLFHQAGSSKAEYATIAPRLVSAGYTALAIDQRSGGSLFGPNETATRLATSASYDQAKPDLVAALDWAKTKHLPVVLWGSSYSAALVFEVAAEHPREVAAVVAFSPGEYLDDSHAVARASAHISIPIYVTSSPAPDEVRAAEEIATASPAKIKTQFVPKFGVHGASTLIADRDPKGASENWAHVLAFLDGLQAGRS